MPSELRAVLRAARMVAPWTLAGVVFFAAISAIWWGLLEPQSGGGDLDTEIVIPEGTAQRIEAGEPAPFIPNVLSLPPGGKLTVINEDTVVHRLGGSTIAPGEVVVVQAEGDEGEFVCSFHPGGALGFSVGGRGPLLATILLPTLILGVPSGLLTGLVVSVARRLGVEGEPSAA